jgi:hypothetical protein
VRRDVKRCVTVRVCHVTWPACPAPSSESLAFLAVHESFGGRHCDVSLGKLRQGEIRINEDEIDLGPCMRSSCFVDPIKISI